MAENKSLGKLPSDLEVKNLYDGRCLITFHIDIPDTKEGKKIGKLPKNMTEKISAVIEKFRERAMKKEFMTTEFIPLTGYPLEELQKDIKEAIKNSFYERYVVRTRRVKHYVSAAMETNNSFLIRCRKHNSRPEVKVGSIDGLTNFGHIRVVCFYTSPL